MIFSLAGKKRSDEGITDHGRPEGVEYRGQEEPAQASDLQVREVGLPKLVHCRFRVCERV